MKQYNFIGVGCAKPRVSLANPHENANEISAICQQAFAQGLDICIFPELSLTGYTCGDLFMQQALLAASDSALLALAAASKNWPTLLVAVGAPLSTGTDLYNCAVLIMNGKILAAIPKTYLPNQREYYEKRWFTAGMMPGQPDNPPAQLCHLAGQTFPLGQQLIQLQDDTGFSCKVGVELSEDLWAPHPVSTTLALAGAELILNLSASNDQVGKAAYRRELICQQSARLNCGYAYVGAGQGESTTDLVFGGHALIAENGKKLAERLPFSQTTEPFVTALVDLDRLRSERRHNSGFHPVAPLPVQSVSLTPPAAVVEKTTQLRRHWNPHPFIPADPELLDTHCEQVFNLQVQGLTRRLQHIRSGGSVIGISGGLDSTLALLVTVAAYRHINFSLDRIVGITMPGFGTTDRTYQNALDLMRLLGVTIREIPIAEAVLQHFRDIGHDPSLHDTTYENSQARERTQILMDVANQSGGIVIGTGDMSELAIGWCTYNGDHMSMYAVNSAVPKTLVRHLVAYFSKKYRAVADAQSVRIADLLDNILDTPVSPELLPLDQAGNLVQQTEDATGPYELNDFFLYHLLRYGYRPKKIALMAIETFSGPQLPGQPERTTYDPETIKKWLRVFCRRFFAQQFKRSCLPDGPKIGSISLSPRGDWKMPSDATAAAWLAELDDI